MNKGKSQVKRAEILPIRFMAFDIETSSLDASYGRLLCACAKFNDEKGVRTVSAPKLKDELAALRQIKGWFKDTDVVYTWYGKMFDLPFVNSRLMHYGERPMEKVVHKDLLFESRSKFRFRGNRLDNVSKDLQTKTSKYHVPASAWVAATDGDSKALAEIIRHCQLDVLLTEEMLGLMKPLIGNWTK